MDFSILYAIQTLRGPVMDALILGLTNIMGSYGQIWLVVGVALCLFPKTRRCGVAVLLSYGLVFLVGQYGLKVLIARPRPCHLDQSVDILTSGGPARSTEVFVYLIYRYAMVDFRMDRASTAAVMFFLILLTITVLTMKISDRSVTYESRRQPKHKRHTDTFL